MASIPYDLTQISPLAMEVSQKIRPAMTKLYVTYFRVAESSDLTGPQLSILTLLDNQGASRISEVARAEGIRMPTASNALHQLERRGLVRRIRDEKDRRGVLVELTEQGQRELQRVGEQREAYLAHMIGTLDEEDQRRCLEFADVVNRLAQAYTAEPISD